MLRVLSVMSVVFYMPRGGGGWLIHTSETGPDSTFISDVCMCGATPHYIINNQPSVSSECSVSSALTMALSTFGEINTWDRPFASCLN